MASQSATAGDIAFRWEEEGDGTPVVLIHGIPTCPVLWRHVLPRIPGARCLAWEMVGYGASIPQGRDRDISVGRQEDYLVDWLKHLDLEQVVLAGHDLGAGFDNDFTQRNTGWSGPTTKRPARARSRRRAKNAGPEKFGRHSQSMPPSCSMSAAVLQSPISA